MEGLLVGVARTEVFRVNPSSFEETVVVAWNAEANLKAARPATYNYSSDGSVSMDCSQVEDEEAELHAAEQQIVRRCYICKSTGHLMAKCPARKAYLASKGRRPMGKPLVCRGKRRNPVGAGRPTGEELSSVEPLGGRSKQIPVPKRSELSKTERECKPGLLVGEGTVKGYDTQWIILIISGASDNYVRRTTVEGSQQYAEALVARESDTVCLATGTRVTVPKVPMDLIVKLLDFNSTERCLFLDLDARNDLILGMAWHTMD
ncbi:unnamed protein product [Peronospora belbahrii]|uniref:CCHC-type domain-containing protein n=1 Tax=Peronospora belbahrii TaxID=622444 RepID=A0AAU9LMB1_9STRA|nr:unnamed protein product [Peronospora belbahrii]